MTAGRCAVLARWLPEKTDAALIFSEHNALYYTGFICDAAALLITREDAVFLTDARYIEAAQKTIGAPVVCRLAQRLLSDAAAWLRTAGIRRVFIEAEQTTLAWLHVLQGYLPDTEVVTDGALDRQIESQRIVKDERELALLRQAQALTDEAFTYVLGVLRPGIRERDVAVELDSYMRRHGAQDVSFRTIAAAGPQTSLPHAQPGDYAVRPGDFVTMDFGALVDGYHADMTRTVAVGTPQPEQRQVYDTVLRAQTAAIAALHAGITCTQADEAARSVIRQAGYGEYFGHSTGHGVGVEIHEKPTLSSLSSAVLPAGCVVTVEPGIYLPGRFGVRIEDMGVVTEQGFADMTASPKQLICL